jgi:hypothetical protein
MAEHVEDDTHVEEEAPRPFVRVVAEQGVGHKARVELVDGDTITELPYVRSAALRVEAGKLNTVDLEVLVVDGNVSAEVIRLREIAVPPAPKPRLVVEVFPPRRRWYGLKRSLCIIRTVTPAGGAGYIVEELLHELVAPQQPACFEASL